LELGMLDRHKNEVEDSNKADEHQNALDKQEDTNF